MANEVRVLGYTTGKTLYFHIINSAGLIWNGTSFVTEVAANWVSYDLPFVEVAGTGNYYGTFPAAITTAGIYDLIAFELSGAVDPADLPVRIGTIHWTGVDEVVELEELDGHYIGVNELKAWKVNGVVVLAGTTFTDAEISRAILLAEERIDKYTDNFFYPKETELTVIYEDSLFFDYPVISITSIEEINNEGEVTYTYPVDSYVLDKLFVKFCLYEYCCGRISIRDMFIREGHCHPNYKRLKVVGVFGYTDVPYSIKEATALLALELLKRGSSSMISASAERVAWSDFSITYGKNNTITDNSNTTGFKYIDDLLNPFIRSSFDMFVV